MSHIQNELWLENAYDNFKGALEGKNYDLARAVIEDTREQGFDSASLIMQKELQDTYITSMHTAFGEYTKNYKRMWEVIGEKIKNITNIVKYENK